MNIPEQAGKVATSVIDSMRSQPLAIALIVVNVIFAAILTFVLYEIAEGQRADRAARNALISQMAKNCLALEREIDRTLDRKTEPQQ